jgi:hypothetical protein
LTWATNAATNQFEHSDGTTHAAMTALIVVEIGRLGVLSAGFVAGQFL